MRRFIVACGMFAVMCTAAMAAPIVGYLSNGEIIRKDSEEKTLPGGAPTEVLTTGGITFNIYYTDVINDSNIGFDSPSVGAAARTVVSTTLTYIASVLHEEGTLDILVKASQTDASGALAFAGTYFPGAAGVHSGSTLERLHDPNDDKPFSSTEEIQMTVDFGYPWNFTANPASFSQFDLQSVITHELTHGLGFFSLSDSTGASQTDPNSYMVFDTFLRRRSGNFALFSGGPLSFQGVAGDLTSNGIAWGGDEAIQAYLPNAAPGIYAPASFALGSSLSHWDTGNIVGGAVMEHAISNGETRREYAPIDLAALRDIGYLEASDEAPAGCDLNACPDLEGQGMEFYPILGGLVSQTLDYATGDFDGSGIPDRFEIALLNRVLCGAPTAYSADAPCVFNANRQKLTHEDSLAGQEDYFDILAGMLCISTDMENAAAALGLTSSYDAVDSGGAKVYTEVLSAGGDPDQDGFSNLEEYQNVAADGGDEADFANAAFNPLLDGSTATAEALPLAGLVGVGALLSALATAGAATMRRKRR